MAGQKGQLGSRRSVVVAFAETIKRDAIYRPDREGGGHGDGGPCRYRAVPSPESYSYRDMGQGSTRGVADVAAGMAAWSALERH
jgi:hypothetical protein